MELDIYSPSIRSQHGKYSIISVKEYSALLIINNVYLRR